VKILFLSHTNKLPNRLLHFIEYFRQNNDILLITWDRYPETRNNFPDIPRIGIQASSSLRGLLSFFRRLFRSKKEIDFDLVYFYDFRMLPGVRLLTCKKESAGVYDSMERPTIHVGEIITSHLRFLPLNFVLSFLNGVEKLLMGLTQGVLVVDSADGEFLDSVRSVQPNSELVMNFPTKYASPDEKAAQRYRREFTGRKLAIYAGGLHSSRGVFKCIKLAARLKEVDPSVLFLLVGEMRRGETVDSLENCIKRCGAQGYVRMLDWLSYPELLALLQLARVGFCLLDPSFYYFRNISAGNSRKTFTYLQAGVPVVTSIKAIGEFLERYGVGVYSAFDDEDSIFEAVRDLLTNDKLFAEMSSKAKEIIELEYNWENEMRKVEKVFSRALEGINRN
jgi:glycosyltransferase involved in cell wall biosynthesis